ncbi:histidine kinase [Microbispora sp. NBC_01189]|uniref:sensor histidine kinase n=1 Tax=Microbispora sp. NBC_01189 TaxID=2903583 RepID=UPI002E11D33E|nr:histidine kinase [Microbispora sp. NBC_01189]
MWVPRAAVGAVAVLVGVAGLAGAAAEGFAASAYGARLPLTLALAGTLAGVGWSVAGALLAWLRPANAIGWLLLVVGTVTQLSLTEEAFAAAGWLGPAAAAGDWMARAPGLVLTLVGGWSIMAMLGTLPAFFPTGRPPGRTWWWPVGVVALGAVLIQLHWLAGQPSDGPLGAVPFVVYLAGAATIWVLAIVRLARSAAPRRQQLAWLLGSVILIIVVNLLGDSLVAQIAQVTSLYLLPAAIAIAVLRYRLLGIDASPRADPVRIVAEIGTHVGAPADTDGELLTAVLAAVRRSVDAPGARIRDASRSVIACSGDLQPDAELPATAFSATLAVGDMPLGVLEVAPRWPEEGFARREERMLAALAAQVAAVLHARGLAEQLEAQRDAAMDARTRERERLRHELHDGLGPALTGMGLGLAGLEDAIRAPSATTALQITGVLRAEVAGTVSEVRRILDDLQPVALEERGFAEAIRRGVVSVAATLPVSVEVGPLPALPPRVEQTAYRVVAEAVTNAVRHAGATQLDVCVRGDEGDNLVIDVRDDGAGFDPSRPLRGGIGLASMRARARELGGEVAISSSDAGTTVTLRVPTAVPIP